MAIFHFTLHGPVSDDEFDRARRIVVIGGGGATQKASDRLEVA